MQAAIKYWNRYNWRWRLKQASTYTVAAADTTITLPYDFKDAYTVRWTGTDPHYLQAMERRQYDRLSYDQTISGTPRGYELFEEGEQGKMGLVPAPSSSGTLILKYYSRMNIPCTLTSIAVTATTTVLNGTALAGATIGSPVFPPASWFPYALTGFNPIIKAITPNNTQTTPGITVTLTEAFTDTPSNQTISIGGDGIPLDIPEDYENGILAWATAHFLSSFGGPQSRLDYFMGLANAELDRALAANEPTEDEDLAFQPATS